MFITSGEQVTFTEELVTDYSCDKLLHKKSNLVTVTNLKK